MKKTIGGALPMTVLPLLVLPLLLCACSQGFLPLIGRLAADPTVQAPRVSSFIEEFSCSVEWDEDPAADSYVLERAVDASSPVFSSIYQGNDLSFTDTECMDQTRYLYRLSKVKGNRTFDASEAVLGVGSATCRDDLEPNDSEQSATPLNYERFANMYWYSSYDETTIDDVDWYSVSIPPRKTGYIVFTQLDWPGSLNLGYTWMFFYLKGSPPVPVVNNAAVQIDNTSYESKTFFFSVYPNKNLFTADPSQPGGNIISYTVSLTMITDL